MTTLRIMLAHFVVIALAAAAAPAQQTDTQQELAEMRAELAKLKAELNQALAQVEQIKAQQAVEPVKPAEPVAPADTEHTVAVDEQTDAQLERLRVQQDRIEHQLDVLLDRSRRDTTNAYATATTVNSASPFDYRHTADAPPSNTRIITSNAPAGGYSTYTTVQHKDTGGHYVRYNTGTYTTGPVVYSTVSYTRPYYGYSYYRGYSGCGSYGYPYYRYYPRTIYYKGYYPSKYYYHKRHHGHYSSGLKLHYRTGNFAIHLGGHKRHH